VLLTPRILRVCTDVIKSRDICCCRHVGGQVITGYTGLVHWELGDVHVWYTTNTKYISINDIMGHTCVAVTAVKEGTRLPFYRFPADPDRKKNPKG